MRAIKNKVWGLLMSIPWILMPTFAGFGGYKQISTVSILLPTSMARGRTKSQKRKQEEAEFEPQYVVHLIGTIVD